MPKRHPRWSAPPLIQSSWGMGISHPPLEDRRLRDLYGRSSVSTSFLSEWNGTDGKEVIDHRQLDFDRPDPKAGVKRGMPGAKIYKDRR